MKEKYDKIGIIGPMDIEVEDLKNKMNEEGDVCVENFAGLDFWSGKLSGMNVVLVRSGVGKVNASMAATVLVSHFKVDAIVNTGIAGSLDASIDIGDIVLAADAVEHDMDVSPLGYDRGMIPDQESSIYKSDTFLRDMAKEALVAAELDVQCFEGRIVSGDQFIASREVKDDLVETFGGMCAEMEGAAIAHVASLSNTPYLIIRSISDKADGSAHMDYPSFQKKAVENEEKLIIAFLKLLK